MDASRNETTTITACIQAKPNELGIEYARIVLTEDALSRLRTLFTVSVEHQLIHSMIDNLPVQWLKNGVTINAEPTYCEVNQYCINFKNYFPASSEENSIRSHVEVSALWILEGIEELETDFLQGRCFNKYSQLEFEDIGSTHLEQINNIAIFDAILARDRIAEAYAKL